MLQAIRRWLASLRKPAAPKPATPSPPPVEEQPLQEDMTLMTNKQTALVRQVTSDLERHEGFREYAYPDPLSALAKNHAKERWGFVPARNILTKLGIDVKDAAKLGKPWTVGHGFTGGTTLDSRMSRLMSERKLEEKVLEVDLALKNTLTWYDEASQVTKGVVINMVFNMGMARVLKFTNTLRYIKEKNYEQASSNMLQSLWARQVKGRATELAERMRTQQIAASHKVKDL